MSEEETGIEIRSEEVQEILGYVPHWIMKSGIGTIFIFLLLLFAGSWYFKYPDILSSNISVTTENPPVSLIARTNGKISMLMVTDTQTVKTGDILAIIENTTRLEHVLELDEYLDSLQPFFIQYDPVHLQNFNSTYQLGSLQNSYSSFLTIYHKYLNFKDLDLYNLKINAINKQLNQTRDQSAYIRRQSVLLKEELDLVSKQFIRDSLLFVDNVISSVEFERARLEYLQKKYSWEAMRTSAINNDIQISQLEQSILSLSLQKKEEQNQLLLELQSAFDILKSDIDLWSLTFLFRSPINGRVSFSKIWSQNQNIAMGENAFTIVPLDQGHIVGKLHLPITGSGKVKTEQKVNIKLNSFPYMEYGTVQGKIKSIALVPEKDFYLVTVELPQELRTNYGKDLPFTQQMNGIADIITENISVLARLFNPLRSIFKNYQ